MKSYGSNPDYKSIYIDILTKKFPHKKNECSSILNKENLSSIDIIELNQKIFGTNKDKAKLNQAHKSYNKNTIIQILKYQKKHALNNSELARHYSLSRNTVAKWKKIFLP